MKETILRIMIPAALIIGCRNRPDDIDPWLRHYRESVETVSTAGDFTLSSMVASPAYLARFRLHGKIREADLDSLSRPYQSAFYVALRLAPNADDALPGAQVDVLGAELAKGRTAYAERLALFQNGMRELCQLELQDGSRVPPISYSFERGWGLRKDMNFLFAFPKTWNGKELDLLRSRFVIKDFGFNLGNFRHALKAPPG